MAGSIKDLSKYRYEWSSEELENAKTMLESGKFKLALNRSYYSIFHGMRAVNVLDEFDSSKHSGVIAHFNQYHVKTGDFPKEASRIIRTSSEMREHADYEDFFTASRRDAEEQVQKAQTFHDFISSYLQKKGILWSLKGTALTIRQFLFTFRWIIWLESENERLFRSLFLCLNTGKAVIFHLFGKTYGNRKEKYYGKYE